MDSGSAMELARYRLEQANNCLKASENNLESDLYKDALNRSYYCIFHSIRAVLALSSFDSSSYEPWSPKAIGYMIASMMVRLLRNYTPAALNP